MYEKKNSSQQVGCWASLPSIFPKNGFCCFRDSHRTKYCSVIRFSKCGRRATVFKVLRLERVKVGN